MTPSLYHLHHYTHTLHTHSIALELLKDPKTAEALLRRLCIICLEDGLLHPHLPLVVWAMAAVVRERGGVYVCGFGVGWRGGSGECGQVRLEAGVGCW